MIICLNTNSTPKFTKSITPSFDGKSCESSSCFSERKTLSNFICKSKYPTHKLDNNYPTPGPVMNYHN